MSFICDSICAEEQRTAASTTKDLCIKRHRLWSHQYPQPCGLGYCWTQGTLRRLPKTHIQEETFESCASRCIIGITRYVYTQSIRTMPHCRPEAILHVPTLHVGGSLGLIRQSCSVSSSSSCGTGGSHGGDKSPVVNGLDQV